MAKAAGPGIEAGKDKHEAFKDSNGILDGMQTWKSSVGLLAADNLGEHSPKSC